MKLQKVKVMGSKDKSLTRVQKRGFISGKILCSCQQR